MEVEALRAALERRDWRSVRELVPACVVAFERRIEALRRNTEAPILAMTVSISSPNWCG